VEQDLRLLKARAAAKTIVATVIALVALVVTVYPAIWMHITAVRTNRDLFRRPWGLPDQIHWENFATAFERSPIPLYFMNSIIVSAASVLIILLLAALAAYPFARLSFRGRDALFYMVVSGLMIPPHVALIPLMVLLSKLQLLGTRFALILPNVAFGLPFAVLLLRSFFLTVPRDLEDAARLDGCTRAGVFWHVMFPLARPTLAVVATFSFVGTWNEFLFALTFIQERALKTLPIGLMDFVGEVTTDWVLISAGLVIATLPVLIVYIVFQKQIIQSMMGGALRG
jgi:raffinose/stachyose/melibiose transport system permease protein